MSREECERLRDLQDRRHRCYLEQIGSDAGESHTMKTPKGPELELKTPMTQRQRSTRLMLR